MRRLSQLVIRRRGWVVVAALVVLPLAGALGSSVKERLSSGGLVDPRSDAARAERLLDERFSAGSPNVLLLVTARSGSIDDAATTAAGLSLTQQLAGEQGVTGVVSYWTLGRAAPLRSKDGRQALVLGRIPGDEDRVEKVVERIAPRYSGDGGPVSVAVGGAGEVFRELSDRAERDLHKAEAITTPITVLLLIVIFGSVAAAGLPLGVAALAVVGTLLLLRIITALTDVSIFALNLTTAMGLGLAIDYSLFVVSRYREELRRGYEPFRAIERTLHTAGRMVTFSALTVAISLGTLLIFPLPILRSFAYAGVGVVTMAAVGAVVVLPALLAIIRGGIDAGTVWRREAKPPEEGFWYGRAQAVMRHPVPVALAVVAVLVGLGVPFAHLRTGLSDDRALAAGAPVRRVHDAIRTGFSARETAALSVVAPTAAATPARAAAVDGYAAALSALPGVARVDASTGFYVAGRKAQAPNQLSAPFENAAGVWLSVVPAVEPLSPAGEALVKAVRRTPAPFPVLVGGESAKLVDGKQALSARLPFGLLVIALATFVLLFLMIGGLLVPLKALALNLLSLSATFGALVWVFQEGHLSALLGFTPTGTISVVMPLLLFCVAFGLSMDYEVFLLSRIKEEYDVGRDNDEAVAIGLQRTGPIVTAAALLLAVVFFAFATSQVVVVKVFGVGVALAVLVDAFLIRATLVPAFMRLAGRANWWAPAPVRRFHLLVGIWETEPLDVLSRVRPTARIFSQRRRTPPGWTLALGSVGAFLAFAGFTTTQPVLTDIVRSFPGTDLAGVSWVQNAYAAMLVAVLVPAARRIDVLGRKRTFLAALANFAVASALCAGAPAAAMMVLARVVQGAAAAVLIPSSLSLMLGAVPGRRRPPVLGLWAGTAALGVLAGAPFGRLLNSVANWHLVFLAGMALAALAYGVGREVLVESKAAKRRRIPRNVRWLIYALALSLLFAAILSAENWGTTSWGAAVAFAASLLVAGFVAMTPTDAGTAVAAPVAEPAVPPPTVDLATAELVTDATALQPVAPESPADFLCQVEMFSSLPEDLRARIAADAEAVRLPAGEWLFHRGDAADGLYIVRAGRLEFVEEKPPAVVGVAGRGDVVGELAILTGGKRSVSVRAARDTDLLRLNRAEFDRLLADLPELAVRLVRILGAHLQASRPVAPRVRPRPVTIAVLTHGVDAGPVADALQRSLVQWGRVAVLSGGEAGSWTGEAELLGRYAPFLDRCEHEFAQVLLRVDRPAEDGPWTDFCLQQADRILVVTTGGPVPEWVLRRRLSLAGCELIGYRVKPGSGALAEWVEQLSPTASQVLARGQELTAGADRLARRLAGRAIGLTLSGGAARALAHVGVLDVLTRAGLAIDRMSGSSMGALIAAMWATGRSVAEIDAMLYEELVRGNPLNDYTVPRVALTRGEKLRASVQRMVGSVAIEELELPFVCVSADLRTGQPVVHRSGPLWEHIRSSLSLPLISPPRLQGKQILVDGGLVSNLPVEPLAAMGEGPVIGVAVRMTADPNQRRSAPQGGAPRLPQIGEILMRTMVLSSATADREAARQATFMIMPATPGIGFFDFDQFDRAVEAGREAARQALAAAAASGAAAGLRPSVAVPADGVDQMLPR